MYWNLVILETMDFILHHNHFHKKNDVRAGRYRAMFIPMKFNGILYTIISAGKMMYLQAD